MTSKSITISDYLNEIPGRLIDEKTFQFDEIKYKNKRGAEMHYIINVTIADCKNIENIITIDKNWFAIGAKIPAELCGVIRVSSWQTDGKIRSVLPTVVTVGKNIGKKNETNVLQQAIRDALSIYNKQSAKTDGAPEDIGGVGTGTGSGTETNTESGTGTITPLKPLGPTGPVMYPPMLAQSYEDKLLSKLKFPAYVQRKYNGTRCIITLRDSKSILMYSRTRKEIETIKHLEDELVPVLIDLRGDSKHDYYLDGELYKHGVPLQDISGSVRRSKTKRDIDLDYMIYDVFIPQVPEMVYSERMRILEKIFKTNMKYVHPVETFEIADIDSALKLETKFISEGYEGAMLRLDSKYEYSYSDYHSRALLKLKPEFDDEFEITGYTVGNKGKTLGAVIMICKTKTGEIFNVVPAMEIADRIALAKVFSTVVTNSKTYFDSYVRGLSLHVTFAELSRDKIPVQPRTDMLIRDKSNDVFYNLAQILKTE